MKTNTITTAVAILGATVALNLSALAGPGPHAQFQTPSGASQKSIATAASKAAKVPSIAFGGTKSDVSESHEIPYVFTTSSRISAPTVVAVPGAHGNTTYLYRW